LLTIIVTSDALVELLVGEMGDQFREDQPASMHPPLLRRGADRSKAPISSVRRSNRSRPEFPLCACTKSIYRPR